ncbi:BsuBI/PstI family type II restriction endonuclease [Corynebacterium pseudodiphtheriticum]|uniref:BsuBI/PstI family type II restriction endonuclease n=1 Tax=Corynebacterium pseudodiphtheriticum TaxID=37637 RepID=UPI00254B48B5|nr:BsuBI/PstI family type II restriction endonuclease [Corynebacterium pseudodiphtheriticum]MDK8718725.1 BsuBI/PstI family type II restriction endonuclease [Corynebacterium pseudodiphtheriticum]
MATIEEAQELLIKFGFDKQRTNELSARTLLSLAQLDFDTPWNQATNNRVGVRALMDWMRAELDHNIAENTRESIRRFVLKQFVEAGFCLHNDDDPARPTNSSKNVYRLSDEALRVLHSYQTSIFESRLTSYLKKAGTLKERYAAARKLSHFDLALPSGVKVSLKSGGQNQLIKDIIRKFCPQFIPNGKVLYIGDADQKLGFYDKKTLHSLGVCLEEHGKMPDLIVYQPDKNWLFLMEACTTHGPIDHWRYGELTSLFSSSKAGLVLVSCFPDRATLRKFIPQLAWETEAWVAQEPTHMLHFNGSRFLGPYT